MPTWSSLIRLVCVKYNVYQERAFEDHVKVNAKLWTKSISKELEHSTEALWKAHLWFPTCCDCDDGCARASLSPKVYSHDA